MSNSKDALVVLVARDKDIRMTMAVVVPRKGLSGTYAVSRLAGFCTRLGLDCHDIIVMSDQEGAMKAVVTELAKWRIGRRTISELSAVGSSASNGIIERGIRSVEGQARVLSHAWKACLAVSNTLIKQQNVTEVHQSTYPFYLAKIICPGTICPNGTSHLQIGKFNPFGFCGLIVMVHKPKHTRYLSGVRLGQTIADKLRELCRDCFPDVPVVVPHAISPRAIIVCSFATSGGRFDHIIQNMRIIESSQHN